jgi:hypothetical protein
LIVPKKTEAEAFWISSEVDDGIQIDFLPKNAQKVLKKPCFVIIILRYDYMTIKQTLTMKICECFAFLSNSHFPITTET